MEFAGEKEHGSKERRNRRPNAPPADTARDLNPGLDLQQQVGNQAMQQLLRAGIIHAKLSISQPDDPEEREADAVADRIMRSHAGPGAAVSTCSCSNDEEMCDECKQKNSATISRKADGNNATTPPHRVMNQLRGSAGHPLDTSTRAFFEPRFGRDLSHVRVHTDSAAESSSRSIQAHAFAAKNNIFFASGQFSPHTDTGRRLLAHELTHVVQQQSGSFSDQRVQRQSDNSATDPSTAPGAADLDHRYQAELANARQTGNWQMAAQLLNGFDKEDIQSRLGVLSRLEIHSMHDGAVANPSVGPDSQIAQLTLLPDIGNRGAQLACVVRLGGCPSSRDGGLPSSSNIKNYNDECRKNSQYTGTDITPTQEECANPPAEPLSTGEQILLGAFLVTAAAVGVAVLVVAGAEVVPAVIAAVGEQALAGVAFYYSNAVVVNEIGIFAVGLIISCEGNVQGLLQTIAKDPTQAIPLLYEVVMLHMNISVANGPPRRASVPVQILPPDEQTEPGRIRFRSVGKPQFDDEAGEPAQSGTTTAPGQLGTRTGASPMVDPAQYSTPEDYLNAIRTARNNPTGAGQGWDYKKFPKGPRVEWQPEDPIDMPEPDGTYPKWDKARARFWRNRASFELDARRSGARARTPNASDPITAMSDADLEAMRDTATSKVRSPRDPVTGVAAEIEHFGVQQQVGRWLQDAGFPGNDARRITGVADPTRLLEVSPVEHAFFDAQAHGFGVQRADPTGRMWQGTPSADPRVQRPLVFMHDADLAEISSRAQTDQQIHLSKVPQLLNALRAEATARGLSLQF